MRIKFKPVVFSLLLLLLTPLTHAALPLPANLIQFDGADGHAYLEKSLKKEDGTNALKLLSHFTTQTTTTYCGVASMVMVLNSSGLPAPEDTEHSSPDQKFYYFNQVDFFNNQVRKIITPEVVLKQGITLNQLTEIARTFGLHAQAHHADQFKSATEFRNKLVNALSNRQFVIANFLRSTMNQVGGGHHSPVAAYDKKRDRFLLLDVARYKYPAYWVTTEDLWNAINTRDDDANALRGVLIMNLKTKDVQ